MESTLHLRKSRAFTLVEILAIIVCLGLIACALIPALIRAKANQRLAQCVSNLRQTGTAFRLWADDVSQNRYPMRYSFAQGGSLDALTNGEVFRHFQCISNELSSTQALTCPADTRQPAAIFQSLQNSNISYFVGVDADESDPRLALAGDRNWEVNGSSMPTGLVTIMTNSGIAWTKDMHRESGNICLADGSVQKFTSLQLQQWLLDAVKSGSTNAQRLAFP
jgi:type II secretory pathway pseudopilin PulG